MTSSKLKKSDQHTHDMTQIEGGHIDDRVGAVPGPDSVNRRVSGPGTEPGSVPGLARLDWAICKRGGAIVLRWRLKIVSDDNVLLSNMRPILGIVILMFVRAMLR